MKWCCDAEGGFCVPTSAPLPAASLSLICWKLWEVGESRGGERTDLWQQLNTLAPVEFVIRSHISTRTLQHEHPCWKDGCHESSPHNYWWIHCLCRFQGWFLQRHLRSCYKSDAGSKPSHSNLWIEVQGGGTFDTWLHNTFMIVQFNKRARVQLITPTPSTTSIADKSRFPTFLRDV